MNKELDELGGKKEIEIPEIIQNHDGDCWFKADAYKLDEYNKETISSLGQEYNGDEFEYKIDKLVYMRPMTEEENEEIGEEYWWTECKEADEGAVAYWSLIAYDLEEVE